MTLPWFSVELIRTELNAYRLDGKTSKRIYVFNHLYDSSHSWIHFKNNKRTEMVILAFFCPSKSNDLQMRFSYKNPVLHYAISVKFQVPEKICQKYQPNRIIFQMDA